MEATGDRDGHHGQTNSISYSSSSGTIVSTQTTNTSHGSRLSSFSMEAAAMHLDLDLEESDYYDREEGTEKGVRIRILLQKFSASANCSSSSIKGGGVLDRERWFTGLGVAWILHLNLDDGGGASAGILEHTTARSWIRALAEITETIRFTASLFPDHPSLGLPSIFPDQFKNIERFMQESMSKMLSFVDIIVALNPNNSTTCESYADNIGNGVPTLYSWFTILQRVHDALSKALSKIRLVFHSPPSPQIERMTGEIVRLLSQKKEKVFEAIWSTMEQIRESIEDSNNSSTCQDPQAGSSDIHTDTRSIIGYIVFLLSLHSSMAPIVSQASRLGKYVPRSTEASPLISLVIEMVTCVEEKLGNKSKSFQDQALMFLFLLNNSNSIRNCLISYPFPSLQVHVAALTGKIES